MPVNISWRHMLQSMKDQYKEGPEKCRDMQDGSKFCMSEKAWSVFFATLRSKGWNETKPASNLALRPEDVKAITPKVFARKRKKKIKDLSLEELEYYHSLFHSQFQELGDKACRLHFKIASEMINRGIPHIRRTLCDGVVQLIHNFRIYDPSKVSDAVLRDDWKISIVWLKKLRQSSKPFESPQFKEMDLKAQIRAIKKLAKSIREEMIKRGWHPKELIKLPYKFNIEDITVQFIQKQNDEALKDLWQYIHKEYRERNKITEDLLHANIFVLTEMYKRGIIDESYEDSDKLDKESRKSWQEYPLPSLSKIISLEQVLEIFSNSGISSSSYPVAYLCGRIVNEKEVPKDHDIDILFKTIPSKELVLAIKNSIPEWLYNKLHFIWDLEGPDIGKSIPIYILSLTPVPKEKMKRSFGEQKLSTLKIGKSFSHLKPRSGFGKYEFWDIKESWFKWGSKYIKNGIEIQEKLDGRSMQLHYDQDTIKIITEDTRRDRASQFPEIKEEVKKLNAKSIILDGEMLEYEGAIEGKNANAKRFLDLIPREETASITTGDIPEEERKKIVYVFYDVLFLNEEDVSQKSTKERYELLKKIVPDDLKYLTIVRGEEARTPGEYTRLVNKYRNLSGSEGVVMKDSTSAYPIKFFGENRTSAWSKIKNLKEIDVLVLKVTPKREKETGKIIPTYMYESYYLVPSYKKEQFIKEDIEEYNGKYYAKIGISYGSGEKASIGDIITIKPIRIRKYIKNEKIRYSWMFPYFKEIKKDKKEADTLTTVERLEKLGTRPAPNNLSELSSVEFEELIDKEQDILITLQKCPYYKEDICLLRDRYESPYLSIVLKETLKHPVKCILASIYRCRYLKEYYYEYKDIGEIDELDGDTFKNVLSFPLRIKQLELQKYLEMPTGEHPFVMQSHLIGSSQHMDFRMKIDGYLVGWSIVGGNLKDPITPEELLSRKDRGFRAEEKEQQDPRWLKVHGELKPGTAGGGTEAKGKMETLTSGEIIWGVQKPYFHEYFVKDDKYFKNWTRIVVRAIRLRKLDPETGEKTKHFERMWRLLIADPMPYAISQRAIKEGYKPPRNNKYPFPKNWVEKEFPEQYQKWIEYIGTKELSNIQYTFSQHSYRGPIHKRASWRRVWYLMLDDEHSNTIRIFRIPDFPVDGLVSAYDEGRDRKKYMDLEGWTKPNTRFNPNKKLIGEMKIISSGTLDYSTEETEKSEEIIILKVPSSILKGTWKLVQEEKGTDTYTLEQI